MRLLCIFSLIFLLCGCTQKAPVIDFIDPKIGNMGEPLIIYGANFGGERGDSYVTIAGTRPTGSSYQLWQDDKIVFRVPEFGESGLVYVFVNGKKSNAALFSDRLKMPKTGNR